MGHHVGECDVSKPCIGDILNLFHGWYRMTDSRADGGASVGHGGLLWRGRALCVGV